MAVATCLMIVVLIGFPLVSAPIFEMFGLPGVSLSYPDGFGFDGLSLWVDGLGLVLVVVAATGFEWSWSADRRAMEHSAEGRTRVLSWLYHVGVFMTYMVLGIGFIRHVVRGVNWYFPLFPPGWVGSPSHVPLNVVEFAIWGAGISLALVTTRMMGKEMEWS